MISRCRLVFTLAAGLSVTALVGGVPASAADLNEQGMQPLAAPAAWKMAITPRVWFAFEDDSFFQNNSFSQQSQETYFYPFYGGSVSAISPGGASYSLTILHGEGDARVNGINRNDSPIDFAFAVPEPLDPLGAFPAVAANGGSFYQGNVNNERTDVEAIAQLPVSEGVVGTVGARYINFQRDENDTVTVPIQIQVGNSFDPITLLDTLNIKIPNQKFSLEQNFWLGELGFGISRPANDSRTIQFFGNITGMFGYADLTEFSTPGESLSGSVLIQGQTRAVQVKGVTGVFNLNEDDLQGAVIGVDTNAGVAFKLAQNVLLSARYRLFYLSPPKVKFDEGGYFIHGPEVNATFTW